MTRFFLFLVLLSIPAKAAEFNLRLLADLESYGGKYLVGDGGASRGWYHMGKAAWNDTTKRRKELKLEVRSWRDGTSTKYWCDVYAKDHLAWLESELSRGLGRRPSEALLYCAWNAGLARVLRSEGDIRKLPLDTQDNAKLFRQ